MSDHPVDDLSALLDGELAGEEEAAVRRHLEACADCRHRLSAVAEARSALRSLGQLEPPAGWTDRFVHRLRRILAVVAGASAAVAAGAVGGMWAAAPTREVTPTADLLSQVTPVGGTAATVPAGALPAGYVAPDRLGGMPRVGVYRSHGTLRVAYSDGVRQVELVEEDGRLDAGWAGALPAAGAGAPATGASATGSPGSTGYRWAGGDALTWQAGPAVMTLVGDPVSVSEAAASMPAPARRETLAGRLRRVCREVLEDLSGSD